MASAIWVAPRPSLCEQVLHHTVEEEPSLHSCIREECHNSPRLTPVQRLQYGVTFRGPSHYSSHLPPPREGPPSLQTLGDTAAEIGGVEVEGGGLMSADTPAPSLWDNRASESKLSCLHCWAERALLQSWPLPTPSYVFQPFFILYLEIFSGTVYRNPISKSAGVRLLCSWTKEQIKSAYLIQRFEW